MVIKSKIKKQAHTGKVFFFILFHPLKNHFLNSLACRASNTPKKANSGLDLLQIKKGQLFGCTVNIIVVIYLKNK
jgi:hypothetical protein